MYLVLGNKQCVLYIIPLFSLVTDMYKYVFDVFRLFALVGPICVHSIHMSCVDVHLVISNGHAFSHVKMNTAHSVMSNGCTFSHVKTNAIGDTFGHAKSNMIS